LLTIHIERDQPRAARNVATTGHKKLVTGCANNRAAGDDAENKAASRNRFRWAFWRCWLFYIRHIIALRFEGLGRNGIGLGAVNTPPRWTGRARRLRVY
jgi:hypothetical protein